MQREKKHKNRELRRQTIVMNFLTDDEDSDIQVNIFFDFLCNSFMLKMMRKNFNVLWSMCVFNKYEI